MENSTQLLAQRLNARGPGGEEDEVRTLCRAEPLKHCDEVGTDEGGNLVGLIHTQKPQGKGATRVLAHMDEIAMVVKRVEADGTLRMVVARAGCIAIPTENTHGFEVLLPAAIDASTLASVTCLLNAVGGKPCP